jgi:transposase-like protein
VSAIEPIDRRAAAKANTVKVTAQRVLELVEAPHPLVEGRIMRCPGCEAEHDILAYTPLNHSRKYEEQVVVPYVCPSCKHIFALRP